MYIQGLPDELIQSKEYYIAYFDILGTKAALKKDEKGTLSKLWLVGNFIKKIRTNGLIVRSFSDNYLFAVEIGKNANTSLNVIFNAAASFSVECLSVYQLFVRGAIVKGFLHIDDEIVLGESLIKAYEIESKIAIYPRIIIDRDVIENIDVEAEPFRVFKKPFFKDVDSSLCVNPLFFFNEKIRMALKGNIVRNIVDSAVLAHDNRDKKSMLKVEWMKNYVNEFYIQMHNFKLLDFDKKCF